jgi:asparagine synthase (glutamine-hydrolysing)
MCGFVGWFDLNGERGADRALVSAMNTAISHRGPDGDGFYFGPGVALGHRRLAIIDLSTGDQPKFDISGTIGVTYNGEIYNYRELRAELIERGHKFQTSSDTEVILEAWREWKQDCVGHFRGMFAFALWDSNEQTLFIARDRLGEKPLYYAELADGTLIFGSELKALLVHPKLQRQIDPCAVEEFFALGYIADPRTIYHGVSKLSAGWTLTARRGARLALRQYWDAVPVESKTNNFDQAAEEVVEQLGQAVQRQLVSDVPVGAFLSGGVDSSATAALMALANDKPIRCFTIGFDDQRFDETAYATEVAKKYRAEHVVRKVSAGEDDIGILPRIFDEPFGDSSALPTVQLARLTSAHVKVTLSGDGGDELFAGYRRYGFHAREEAWRNVLPAPVRKPVFATLGKLYPQLDWAPRIFRARHTFEELSLDACGGYFWNVSVTDDETRARLFSKSFKAQLQGYNASEVIRLHMAKAPSDDSVTIAQYVDLKTWLVGDILTKVDRAAMAFGLETRVPMLDHHFVEMALGLPSRFKIRRGESKAVLKRGLERLLPRDVLYRPKQGFSVPLADWFRNDLGKMFRTHVLPKLASDAEGLFNVAFVEELLDQHQSGVRDHARTLWLVWMFQRFLEEVHFAPLPAALPAAAISR